MICYRHKLTDGGGEKKTQIKSQSFTVKLQFSWGYSSNDL